MEKTQITTILVSTPMMETIQRYYPPGVEPIILNVNERELDFTAFKTAMLKALDDFHVDQILIVLQRFADSSNTACSRGGGGPSSLWLNVTDNLRQGWWKDEGKNVPAYNQLKAEAISLVRDRVIAWLQQGYSK